MSSSAFISRQLRLVLSRLPDALPLSELLVQVDQFCVDCSAATNPNALTFQLEKELQTIHHDVDHSSPYQIGVFLAVIYRLSLIISSTSIISTWFDLLLRPALRSSNLPTTAVNHAKELIKVALQKTDDEKCAIKVLEFRQRLLDLYLHDTYNEGSGDDAIEWATLDKEEKDRRQRWKSNLEDVLLTFGTAQPTEFMDDIHNSFSAPSTRLPLLTLLNAYAFQNSFDSCVAALANHHLMSSLLSSLLLDNSSTVCTINLTLLIKLLPALAVKACSELKQMLPRLFIILARLICWKERPPFYTLLDTDSTTPEREVEALRLVYDPIPKLKVRMNLGWERLESTFDATYSSAPNPNVLFSVLYYLFPCNTLIFLRAPVLYLTERNFESPYTVSWEDALDEDELRSKSEVILWNHVCHPLIIWRNADEELANTDIWSSYDVFRIAAESRMLDTRNSALANRQQSSGPPERLQPSGSSPLSPIDLGSGLGVPQLSLQNMITASMVLKSSLDIEVDKGPGGWPFDIFTHTAAPSRQDTLLGETSSGQLEEAIPGMPSPEERAIAALQREILLLRNELNLELWFGRENVKHIGRLHASRILSKNAEAERQALYNTLRKHRAQVVELERELSEHKEQAASAKHRANDYQGELHKKLQSLREEKKKWDIEAAELRTKEKDAQALFSAQRDLLEAATKELFEMQTQRKELQHKIDRLRDYERQIEQHIKLQRLWDEDFARFNEREGQIRTVTAEYKKIQLCLKSFEETQAELCDKTLFYKRKAQALELQLTMLKRKSIDASRRMTVADLDAASVEERVALSRSNDKLREENSELRDEVEELMAMVEILRGQKSGQKGVVSPRRSPLESSVDGPRPW